MTQPILPPSPASKTLIIWGVVIAGCLAIFLCGGGIGAYFYFKNKTPATPTSTSTSRDSASARQSCSANLRGIIQSMVVYANENDDYYPVITANGAGVTVGNWNAPCGSAYNVFSLVGRGDVGAKQFLCKSDPASINPTTTPTANPGAYPFYTPTYFTNPAGGSADFCNSYSFATPFYGANIGMWWKNTMDSSCPIAADMNPGSCWMTDASIATKGNSVNHSGEGQNVAFGDAHTEFTRDPFCGESNDMIYSNSQSGTGNRNVPPSQTNSTDARIPASNRFGNVQGTFDTWLVPAAAGSNYTRQ